MDDAAGPPTLTDLEIADALNGLPGWRHEDGRLVRELRLASFRDAIDLVVRIADLADLADHHPELRNVYRDLTVVLWTHEAGGITDRDLDLARAIDGLAPAAG